jgi:hypothetical protein
MFCAMSHLGDLSRYCLLETFSFGMKKTDCLFREDRCILTGIRSKLDHGVTRSNTADMQISNRITSASTPQPVIVHFCRDFPTRAWHVAQVKAGLIRHIRFQHHAIVTSIAEHS